MPVQWFNAVPGAFKMRDSMHKGGCGVTSGGSVMHSQLHSYLSSTLHSRRVYSAVYAISRERQAEAARSTAEAGHLTSPIKSGTEAWLIAERPTAIALRPSFWWGTWSWTFAGLLLCSPS